MARQRYSAGMTSKGRELWAILLLFVSIFIFISLNIPNSTGFVGFWFVDYFARNLFGMGVDFTPLFFAVAALSLFFSEKTQYKWILIGSLAPLVVASIYLEFYVNGVPQDLSFPIAVDGGGLVGVSLGYVLYNSLGRYGTTLILASVIVMSAVMLFNVSLKKVLEILRSFLALCVTLCLSSKDATKKKKQLKTFTGLMQELFRMLCYRDTREQRYRDKDLNSAMKTLKKPAKPETIIAPEPKVLPKITQVEEPSDSFEDEDDIDDLDTEPAIDTPINVSSDSQLFASYQLPPFKLLNKPKKGVRTSKAMLKEAQDKALVLEETLASFNVEAKVVNITPGPSVTRYELQPGQGVKVSKITNLAQDLALNLAAQDVRIEAPIPGKALVGIEVPNTTVDVICLKSLIDKSTFLGSAMGLPCAMGMTITGDAIMMPLEKMPHVLIAGSTGSGKSVCINTIILSILMRSKPDEVKFLMIDPKKVELSLYEDIPHLLAPVVTNPQKAAATLKQWALVEMEKRYEDFAKVGVKDILGYNNYIQEQLNAQATEADEDGVIEVNQYEKLPYIVVIIDELADLMMVAAQEVENTICRLAQMARATGIHLVVATQRPSVNVVTGLIKANIPSRISFAVQSQIDSRTILDTVGAEKLLGRGDMLYLPTGMLKPLRVQGVFVQEDEVKRVVSYVKKQGKPMYNQTVMEIEVEESDGEEGSTPDDVDELFDKAREIVQSTQYASTSYLQRKLRIGYNRAARIMDELEEQGVIGGYDGEKKTRTVLS